MRLFANSRCRTLLICGTLLIFGAMPSELQAQDGQAQSSLRSDMALFDEFLEARADLDAQLRANPSLLTNDEFLENHAQLQNFLVQHPNLRAQINQNPSQFFKERENFHAARRNRGAANPNPDLTRQQVADMDRFLDNNPQIDRDLRRNPSLLTDADYLQDHPGLQSFLNQHPEMKEEIAENPRYFMQREGRFDAQESARARANTGASVNANPDLTRQEVATMGDFLDRHPDIGKSLQKKPNLINDKGFLKRHKDLDEFLNEHPAVREEVRENPSFFMNREQQFEARNTGRDRAIVDRDRDVHDDRDRGSNARDVDTDLDRKELKDMDHFLDKHKGIEKDLRKKPELVNDRDYLRHHKSLEAFLDKNPRVGDELRENPARFLRDQERFERRSHRMNNRADVKTKTDEKKIDEKEKMSTPIPH
jgi:phage-related protein